MKGQEENMRNRRVELRERQKGRARKEIPPFLKCVCVCVLCAHVSVYLHMWRPEVGIGISFSISSSPYVFKQRLSLSL